MIYLDASALVALVAPETRTSALDAWLTDVGDDLVTSQLSITEVARAIVRAGQPDTAERVAHIGGLALRAGSREIRALPATADVFTAAGRLAPPTLRSLDAIHLATALALGPALRALVTYDTRQADAARALGLVVHAPS
ncbi:MAG: type II toxin-antitoxin system VapC family toxin [Demequinaceae bacterium]|nr:type II toxin-antitoxin system VapC family toxin [Demequinaceae bacterium]